MSCLKGLHTVLITPFTEEGLLDREGLRRNIRHQIEAGVDGLVTLGTTSETPTLSAEEQEEVVRITIEEAKNKLPIMIGTGSNSTKTTIENSLKAQAMGADSLLVVTPYYNKPTQEGIYRHFKAVAEAVEIPLILYNIAGRTGQNIQTETLRRLFDIPNIIGVKEASGNIGQMMDVLEAASQSRPDFTVLSGDDALTLPLISLGGQGVLSVVSNLLPHQVKSLVEAALAGDFAAARKIHFDLLPIFKGAFVETNPIPIKAAMNLWDMAAGPCRLPLCELSPQHHETLKALLQRYQTQKPMEIYG